MKTSNVSVVIPAYNARFKIEPTLESIFSQSTQPLEVIVIDDGSTDGTYEFLRESKYPLVLKSQDNRGPSAARNHGVSIACGEWIAFCDADDLWSNNKLQVQLATHAKYPDISASFTNISFMKDGEYTGKMAAPDANQTGMSKIIRLLGKEVLFPSTLLIRKRDFISIGGFDEKMRWAEDIDLVLRMINTHSIMFIGEVLATHQIFTDSLSRSVNSEKGNLHIIDAWKAFLQSKNTSSKEAKRMARTYISGYFYDLAYDCNSHDRRKYYYYSWAYNKLSIVAFIRYLRSFFS